ncbi:MAG: CAP domain-containing protein [Bacteriovoracaceae bacterium]
MKITTYLFLILILVSCNKEAQNSLEKLQGSLIPTKISESNLIDPAPAPDPSVEIHQQFMILINNHRESIGLKALIDDEGLNAIAEIHSQNMASGSVEFGHTGFSDRCREARIVLGGGNLCGENVAMGQRSAKAVFDSWMNSPGHRANIENSRYTHSGFGFEKNMDGRYYWTHLFLEHY